MTTSVLKSTEEALNMYKVGKSNGPGFWRDLRKPGPLLSGYAS